jgi:hypothetical protein
MVAHMEDVMPTSGKAPFVSLQSSLDSVHDTGTGTFLNAVRAAVCKVCLHTWRAHHKYACLPFLIEGQGVHVPPRSVPTCGPLLAADAVTTCF